MNTFQNPRSIMKQISKISSSTCVRYSVPGINQVSAPTLLVSFHNHFQREGQLPPSRFVRKFPFRFVLISSDDKSRAWELWKQLERSKTDGEMEERLLELVTWCEESQLRTKFQTWLSSYFSTGWGEAFCDIHRDGLNEGFFATNNNCEARIRRIGGAYGSEKKIRLHQLLLRLQDNMKYSAKKLDCSRKYVITIPTSLLKKFFCGSF